MLIPQYSFYISPPYNSSLISQSTASSASLIATYLSAQQRLPNKLTVNASYTFLHWGRTVGAEGRTLEAAEAVAEAVAAVAAAMPQSPLATAAAAAAAVARAV